MERTRFNSKSGQVVERGETYDHAEYGRVEVTRIWRGVQQVDAAHNTDETDVIIVRYATEQGECVLASGDHMKEYGQPGVAECFLNESNIRGYPRQGGFRPAQPNHPDAST